MFKLYVRFTKFMINYLQQQLNYQLFECTVSKNTVKRYKEVTYHVKLCAYN